MTDSLDQRVREMVFATPAIDCHTHIPADQPSAQSLADLMFYHWLVTELETIGLDPRSVAPNLSAEERIRNALPYLPGIVNTSTYWCFISAVRDLYDLDVWEITESNWQKIDETIRAASQREDWLSFVLRERAKIYSTFLTFECNEPIPEFDRRFFEATLRIDQYINDIADKSNLRKMAEQTGIEVTSCDAIEAALAKVMDIFLDAKSRTLTGAFVPKVAVAEPSRSDAEAALQKLLSAPEDARPGEADTTFSHSVRPLGNPALTEEENLTLIAFAFHAVLKAANERELPFQIMFGIDRPLPGGKAASAWRERQALELCELFQKYPKVSFELTLGNVVQTHQTAVLAKCYRNVRIAGYWWYTLLPVHICEELSERIEMLPAAKIGGFFTDAYNVEWSYGKGKLLRTQLSKVLAEKVREGYFSEDVAARVASALLFENSRRVYGLDVEAP